MRNVWPVLAVVTLALTLNACGDEAPSTDGGAGRGGGGGAGRGGTAGGGRGGTGGGTAGSTGGSAAGTGGGTAGSTGGSTAGSGGGTAGSTGGSTAGSGGGTAGSTGGSAAGTGGAGGRGGSGGGTAGSTGGSAAGTGGSGTAGSTGGSAAGTGGSAAGRGGSTGGSAAGTGGGTAGSTGGSAAGTGGTGGGTAGSTGGSTAGSGGATGGTGGGTAGSTGGSATGTGGSAGTGGGGGSVACTSPSTCPGGTDTECQTKTCINNVCGLAFAPTTTVVASQTPNDCKRNVCDGIGGVMPAIFDTDTPLDDGNACTDETCVSGLPSHPPEPARTACAQSGGTLCNGSAATPACVVCTLATDCAGTDTICQKRVCGNQWTCGFSNAPAGTDAEPDAPNNCRKAVCDSSGGVTSAPNDSDTPGDDGNPCTDDVCSSGAPSHPAKADGTACTGPGGGTRCFGAACVQCLAVADCPGMNTICRTRTCQSDHTCGGTNASAGTPAEADAVGNCQKLQCDGNGGTTSVADDTDKPDDTDPCTSDVCTNGVPTNPDLPRGTVCSTDGSKACDAAGACNNLTFRVVRVGNAATGTLPGAAVPVVIDERRADGSLVETVALPTTASGANRPLTMTGNSTSEGHLSLSSNGRYLALAGYPAAVGDADPSAATGAAVNRIVGRVDVAGAVNTTTSTVCCNQNNVRSATTTNGTDFWVAGAGMSGSGGVWYTPLAATTGEVRVVSTPGDVRAVNIFGNQLYGTSNANTFANLFTIGSGTPTAMNQTSTPLPGMPTAAPNASPQAYALFDLPGGPSTIDTAYVADRGDGAAGMPGVHKWTFNGTTWTRAAVLSVATGTPGFRGIAGYAVGSTVTLMATTFETNPSAGAAPNRLVLFVDTQTGTPVGTVVATLPVNTQSQFRGVAVSPHFPAP